MNAVLSYLQSPQQTADWKRHVPAGRLHCLAKTPRFRASRHVVILIFSDRTSDPLLVAKIPRLPEDRWSIEREAANLVAAHQLCQGGYDSIPRLVALDEFRGFPILIETALSGRPVNPAAIRRARSHWCRAVVNWLCQLPLLPAESSQQRSTRMEQLVLQPLEQFSALLPLNRWESRLFEQARQIILQLQDEPLGTVLEHGDLSHPNILQRGVSEVSVVDWELARVEGLPACDLFFFLGYAASASSATQSAEDSLSAFDQAFFGPAAWARQWVREYAERLNLPPRVLTPLFLLSWIRYVVNASSRLVPGGEFEGTAPQQLGASLRNNRYFLQWRHAIEHIDRLGWK